MSLKPDGGSKPSAGMWSFKNEPRGHLSSCQQQHGRENSENLRAFQTTTRSPTLRASSSRLRSDSHGQRTHRSARVIRHRRRSDGAFVDSEDANVCRFIISSTESVVTLTFSVSACRKTRLCVKVRLRCSVTLKLNLRRQRSQTTSRTTTSSSSSSRRRFDSTGL